MMGEVRQSLIFMKRKVIFLMYVYDTVVAPYETTIHRYGGTYTLKNISRMDNQRFFKFECSGRESILVVPRFVEQFRAVEKVLDQFKPSKKEEAGLNFVRKHYDRHAVAEVVPNDLSATGQMTLITVKYEDIQLQFEYMNQQLTLVQEFEILDKNLFGNGIVVSLNINTEG